MKFVSSSEEFHGNIRDMIKRSTRMAEVEAALQAAPVVSLLGPRQSGKTTLARAIARRHKATFFDL